MSAALSAEALFKSFDSGRNILDGVDLHVAPGEFLSIQSPKQAGRTTLLHCLSGDYRPSAGTVMLSSPGAGMVDLAAADARTLAWARSYHVRSFAWPLAAPPSQDAATAVSRAAQVGRPEAIAALERLGLACHADVPLGRLRQADRRAVALAAVLRAPVAVLLLDEPETAADPDRVAAWLQDLRSTGTAVIAALVQSSPLQSVASASAILTEGKLQWTKQ